VFGVTGKVANNRKVIMVLVLAYYFPVGYYFILHSMTILPIKCKAKIWIEGIEIHRNS
jgi:hypothetical protein